MAKLEHVSIWKDKGWVPITAEQAKKLHPGGTVSACSGLFLCDLCEQYVTFTDGPIRDRYFRHAKDNIYSQQCPDYTRGTGANSVAPFKPEEYYLPIRLVFKRDKNVIIDYHLEIGLPPLNQNELKNGTSFKIKINDGRTCELDTPAGLMCQYQSNYEYLSWRLHENGWNYLSVGSIPAKKYRLHITPENHPVTQIWPREFEGIVDSAIFGSSSCKKVPYHASIRTNTEYYLLTRKKMYFPYQVEMIHCVQKNEWHIYRFKITKTDKCVVKKFLELGYRLDDSAVLLQVVWPVYVKSPHVILHKQGDIWFYKHGTARIKTFPDIDKNRVCEHCSQLSEIVRYWPKDRNQLIAAGRLNVLKYLYLWEDDLSMQVTLPSVVVQTHDGEPFANGNHEELPEKQMICIRMDVDGFAEVYRENVLVNKYPCNADKITTDIRVQLGDRVEVYAGLDLIWTCSFVKPNYQRVSDEELYKRLIFCRGNEIECSHSMWALVEQLGDCPKVRMWLRQRIHIGKISMKAIDVIKHIICGRF